MDIPTYLITAFVAAAMFYAGYHAVLLMIRTTNPVYGILLACTGAAGLLFIKQSSLIGEGRETAVSICTLALFTGAAAVLAARLNKSIDKEERTLKSIVKRFVSHLKLLQ